MKKIILADAVRGFAASYVFAGHLVMNCFPRTARWTVLFLFGQEGVMLFFLLSGFVVMYSMETGADKSFGTYIGRRFFRIYPIFILALALSYALAASWSVDLKVLVGNLLMLQDFTDGKPGVLFGTFEGDLPLWSLSYEWWFYLMYTRSRHDPKIPGRYDAKVVGD
jgi:peptidoglycan/LPS O-acetylase OafA/YrhL